MDKIIEKLVSIPGIIEAERISDSLFEEIFELEKQEEGEVYGGIAPAYNSGVYELMKSDRIYVVMHTTEFRDPESSTIVFKTLKGDVVGREVINDYDKQFFVDSGTGYILDYPYPGFIVSSDIADQNGVMIGFFELPPVGFSEIPNATSASPGWEASKRIIAAFNWEKYLDWPPAEIPGSILIGV
jgi:hypothetical protein